MSASSIHENGELIPSCFSFHLVFLSVPARNLILS